jgi:hypothetical protein
MAGAKEGVRHAPRNGQGHGGSLWRCRWIRAGCRCRRNFQVGVLQLLPRFETTTACGVEQGFRRLRDAAIRSAAERVRLCHHVVQPFHATASLIAGSRCRLVRPRLVLRGRAASALRVETLRDLRDVDFTIRSSMAPLTITANATMLAPTAAPVTAPPTLAPTPRLLRTQRWSCRPSMLRTWTRMLRHWRASRRVIRYTVSTQPTAAWGALITEHR